MPGLTVTVEFLPDAERDYLALEQSATGQQERQLLALMADWMNDERHGFGTQRRVYTEWVPTPAGTEMFAYSRYPKGIVGGVAGWQSIGTFQKVRIAAVGVYGTPHEFDMLVKSGVDSLTQEMARNGSL